MAREDNSFSNRAYSCVRWARIRATATRTARILSVTVLVLVVLLIAARIAAPWIIRAAINDRLASLDGYSGHVEDIDLHLWRGAYKMKELRLTRTIEEEQAPFLSAATLDFSLSWGEILKGRIRSEITADNVDAVYVVLHEEDEATPLDEPRWQDVVEDLFPIEITKLAITNATVSYIDENADPTIDLSLGDLVLAAVGLSNRPTADPRDMPASIQLHGTTVGGGFVELDILAAPLADAPRFDIDASITGVHLPALNDFLRAHGNIDVAAGTLQIYTEVTAAEGRFEGYVKPLIEDLKFDDWATEEQSVLDAIWEQVVSVVAFIVKNHSRDQLGTLVPFAGEFEQTEVGTWTAVGNTLRHGFINAFSEGIEGSQSPGDVGDANQDSESPTASPAEESGNLEPEDVPVAEEPEALERVQSHRR